MPAVSVIMPVYNSERFLATAIDSVLNQIFVDFELILVNDGSIDSSGAICDDYKKKDSRIKVIHQKNGGICIARNVGLQNSSGKYIAFIDNDDIYLNKLLFDNIEIINKYPVVDIIKFGYHVEESFDNGEIEYRDTVSDKLYIIDKYNLAKNYVEIKLSGFFNMVWNGLYRREYLIENNLKFDENIRYGYEDWAFNYSICLYANKIILNPQIYYNHIQRTGISTSKKFYINRPYGCLSAAISEMNLFEKLQIDRHYPYLWSEYLMKYLIEIIQLFHYKDCNLKLKGKIDFLKTMKDNSPFSKPYNKNEIKHLWKISKTKSIVRCLYYNKNYKTLLLLSKLYNIKLKLK